MKKLLWTLWFLLWAAVGAGAVTLVWDANTFAAPFLVCDDPTEQVQYYIVTIDDGEKVQSFAPLHFDLSGLSEGSHIIKIKAVTIYGLESAEATFKFEASAKILPWPPTGLTLSNE